MVIFKNFSRQYVVLVIISFFFNNQIFSQSTITTSGGDFKSDKNSFSFTVGQILTSQDLSKSTSLFGENVILSHGVQQVFIQNCDDNSRVEIIATPNPSSGIVTLNLINWDEEEIQYNVFDVLGKNVLSSSISDDQLRLDLSFLSSGMYIISLGYHCGSLSSFKIIIDKK